MGGFRIETKAYHSEVFSQLFLFSFYLSERHESLNIYYALASGVNPQALVNQYAGTGQATINVLLGQAGSREMIVTNQVIGDYVKDGINLGPTTNFTIHYAKDGVHIVPARPTL